jgi:hypothetical protein
MSPFNPARLSARWWVAIALVLLLSITGAWILRDRSPNTVTRTGPGAALAVKTPAAAPRDVPPPPDGAPDVGDSAKKFAEYQKGIKPEVLKPGIPVEGKPGFVYSPYYSAGFVDVAGVPSGTKVRCPYTQKTFLVP